MVTRRARYLEHVNGKTPTRTLNTLVGKGTNRASSHHNRIAAHARANGMARDSQKLTPERSAMVYTQVRPTRVIKATVSAMEESPLVKRCAEAGTTDGVGALDVEGWLLVDGAGGSGEEGGRDEDGAGGGGGGGGGAEEVGAGGDGGVTVTGSAVTVGLTSPPVTVGTA